MTFGRVRVTPKNKFRWQFRWQRQQLFRWFNVDAPAIIAHLFMFHFISDVIQLVANLMHTSAFYWLRRVVCCRMDRLRRSQFARSATVEAQCKFRGTNLRHGAVCIEYAFDGFMGSPCVFRAAQCRICVSLF